MIADLPPLNAVRAFAAAARHESFSRAAEELHVSHSAVSRHIKLLEEHLGVLLFERRVRQSILTPAGQAFYEQVSVALTQIASAAASLRQGAALRKVTLNVRPSFAVRWLIPRLPNFMAQHPQIQPEVVTSTQYPDPARETFDLVIRRGRAGWSAALQPQRLLEDEMLLVAAPALLHNTPLASARDLGRHTLLTSRTRATDWSKWTAHCGLAPLGSPPTLQFDHMHFVLQACVDGLGLALCPASLLGKDLASGRLVCPLPTLHQPLPRYYYALSPEAGADAELFMQWMRAQIEQDALDNVAQVPVAP